MKIPNQMRLFLLIACMLLFADTSFAKVPSSLVFVHGGSFKDTRSNFFGHDRTVSNFYIGKYDVTQQEWMNVMGTNPSRFKGDNLPVETVSWYASIEYCNSRSKLEGLQPYYKIEKAKQDPQNKPDPKFGYLDDVRWKVTSLPAANGYRLPTEAEWEYAASGGQASRSYLYSGGDKVDDVAWYWRNAGQTYLTGFWLWSAIEQNKDQTKPVGSKKPNELGLYDMSGNVRQWCWDWYGDLKADQKDLHGRPEGYARVWKGGGWIGAEFCCATAFRGSLAANGTGPDQGFRICRNA